MMSERLFKIQHTKFQITSHPVFDEAHLPLPLVNVNSKNYCMKKLSSLFAGLFLLALSFNAYAQSKTGADYFAGKWNVSIMGTPYGAELKRVYILEKKDNGLTGTVLDSTGKEIAKCSKVDVSNNDVTLYYNTMNTDVSIVLTKQDDDHVTGKAMGMYDAKGERAK